MTAIDALLALLDDTDPAVRSSLSRRLSSDPALLDQAWAAACERGDPPEPLAALVVAADAAKLATAYRDAPDLETGAWLLARLHRPRLDHAIAGRAALDALAARLPPDCDGGDVAGFLCHDCGFAGDRREYDHPRNNFLPLVLERRLGMPIALTTLWLLICRRRGLDVAAIALPGHVVCRWRAEDGSDRYIDCFAGGKILVRAHLDAIARTAGDTSAGPYLAPASDRALLRRTARNLVAAYSRRGDRVRAGVAQVLAV